MPKTARGNTLECASANSHTVWHGVTLKCVTLKCATRNYHREFIYC